MDYVFPPAPRVVLPVVGSKSVFPVRRVFCVGRNYADHVAEMGADSREPPFFFCKPADALVPNGGDVAYPPQTADLQHEVELVVALGRSGANLSLVDALASVFGYAVGIDLTRRDLQAQAKKKGLPWDMGKGFDCSAPISAIVPATSTAIMRGNTAYGRIQLDVNGVVKQKADLSSMLWNVAEIIANLSTYVTLAAGDLIYTGTPSGVSTVVRGDVLDAAIDGVGKLTIRLV